MIEPSRRPEEFEFSSEDVRACPYAFYDAVRPDRPVYRLPNAKRSPDDADHFLLTRYEDVRFSAHRTDLFSSHRPDPGANDPEMEAITANGYPPTPTLVTLDPPEHTRVRKLVSRSFDSKAVAALEPKIRAVIDGLIDGFEAAGEVEFMSEFALPFPTRIIGDVLGVPPNAQEHFRRWSDAIADSVSLYISRERALECRRSIVEMQLFFAELVDERRTEPRDDLLSDFVSVRIDGERPLDVAEIMELIRIFLVGGNETTASLLGSAVYLLLQHPDQLRAVLDDFGLIPQMLEEVLRLETPVQWTPRIVEKNDVELQGVPMPAGSRLLVGWGPANRDPARFGAEAARFDIHRRPTDHVAFGHGVHFCLGAGLARLEARLALESLFTRVKNIRLGVDAADVRYVGPFTRRIDRLPLIFDRP